MEGGGGSSGKHEWDSKSVSSYSGSLQSVSSSARIHIPFYSVKNRKYIWKLRNGEREKGEKEQRERDRERTSFWLSFFLVGKIMHTQSKKKSNSKKVYANSKKTILNCEKIFKSKLN